MEKSVNKYTSTYKDFSSDKLEPEVYDTIHRIICIDGNNIVMEDDIYKKNPNNKDLVTTERKINIYRYPDQEIKNSFEISNNITSEEILEEQKEGILKSVLKKEEIKNKTELYNSGKLSQKQLERFIEIEKEKLVMNTIRKIKNDSFVKIFSFDDKNNYDIIEDSYWFLPTVKKINGKTNEITHRSFLKNGAKVSIGNQVAKFDPKNSSIETTDSIDDSKESAKKLANIEAGKFDLCTLDKTQKLLIVLSNRKIKVFNAQTGKSIKSVNFEGNMYTGDLNQHGVTNDNHWLVARSYDKIFDIDLNKIIQNN